MDRPFRKRKVDDDDDVSSFEFYGIRLAVPWLRRLVAEFSLLRPGFLSGSEHVGFVVDKVALGQIFL
jgi:hypothetical protein